MITERGDIDMATATAVQAPEAPGAPLTRPDGPLDLEEPECPSHMHDRLRLEELCSLFECNICLELARDPVVTLCGHLYCWPCLYR